MARSRQINPAISPLLQNARMFAVLLRLLLSVILVASGTQPAAADSEANSGPGAAGHGSSSDLRCQHASASSIHTAHGSKAAVVVAGDSHAAHACCNAGDSSCSNGCCEHDGACASQCAHAAPVMLPCGSALVSVFAPAPLLAKADTLNAGPGLARLIRPPIA
jgi:hypothetical protein